MVRMGTILPETIYGLKRLDELNIGRLKKHGENGFIVISANRSAIASENPDCSLIPEYADFLKENNIQDSPELAAQWLKKRNKKADEALRNELVNSKYSFSSVFGGYHGTDSVVDEFEPSYVVYNYTKTGESGAMEDLFKFALDLCGKYKQDSVYVQAPGESPNYYNAHGVKVNTSSTKNFKLNRDGEEFYTTAKRDKNNPQRFTADIQFEQVYRKIYERTERMKRAQEGEYIL